jgi:hypothetical protein
MGIMTEAFERVGSTLGRGKAWAAQARGAATSYAASAARVGAGWADRGAAHVAGAGGGGGIPPARFFMKGGLGGPGGIGLGLIAAAGIGYGVGRHRGRRAAMRGM